MFKGYDYKYPVDSSTLGCFYNNNVRAVGRYLCPTSVDPNKGLKLTEAQEIHQAGLRIWSVYETNPTYPGYFTSSQGYSDYSTAVSLAAAAGQPVGMPIFLAVDTDVVSDDYWKSILGSPSNVTHLSEVLDYFTGINQAYNDYLGAYTSGSGSAYYGVGVYGGYYTVSEIVGAYGMASFTWQTAAWSNGSTYSNNAAYQNVIGTTECGTSVDIDDVYSSAIYW